MKRFIALLLLVLLAIAPFSASRAANSEEKYTVYIWGVALDGVNNQYYKNGPNGAKGSVVTATDDWNAHYDKNAGTLTLRNLRVTGCNAAFNKDVRGISYFGDSSTSIIIELVGDNRVSTDNSGESTYVVRITQCKIVVIKGSGTLTATAGSSKKYSVGISIGDEFVKEGTGSITGIGGNATNVTDQYATSVGVSANGKLSISGGTITGIGGAGYTSVGVQASNIIAKDYGTIKGTGGPACGTPNGVGVDKYRGHSFGVETLLQTGNITVKSGSSITGTGGHSTGADGNSYGVCSFEGGVITVEDGGYLQGMGDTATSGKSYGIFASAMSAGISVGIHLEKNATTVAQGHSQALYIAATGKLQVNDAAVASVTYDGSGAGSYNSANNSNYKYFRMPEAIKATQMTITQDTFPFGQAPENETITLTPNTATFNFNASNSFGSATMDGKRLDLGNVGNPGGDGSVSNGSIVIHLNKAYLDTLPAGTHILVVNLAGVYAGQTVRTTITVLPSGGGTGGDVGPDVPKTGDNATPVLWLGLILLAGAGLAVSAVRRRRRQNG